MDENDQCGLLKSFGLIRNLTELSLCVRRWSDLDSFHYYSSKLNTFYRLTQGRVEKRLKLDGRSLASRWLLNVFFLSSNDDLDAILSTDLGKKRRFKILVRQIVSLNKTKIICSVAARKRFVACGFCGVKISHVIGYNTINIPDIF